MAAVFMMQPLGQIMAAAVGWSVLTSVVKSRGLDNINVADASTDQELRSAVDTIWRTVIGVGAFPALLATLWRFSIPESPRYTMDVDRDVKRALADVQRHHKKNDYRPTAHSGSAVASMSGNSIGVSSGVNYPGRQVTSRVSGNQANSNQANDDQVNENQGNHNNANDGRVPNPGLATPRASANIPNERTFYSYLFKEGNWRYLFATSFCWALLDFAFYGLGISSPRQLGQIWDNTGPPRNTTLPYWENPFDSNTTLYWQLFNSAKEYVYTICFGSLAGSILLYFIIDYIPRKAFLVRSFLILSFLFIITATLIATVEFRRGHWATVVFYALCQFFFNLGEFILSHLAALVLNYRC